MSIKINKPISRSYLMQSIRDFEEYSLYETFKNVKVIDVKENYVRDDGTNPNAILVDTTNIYEISLFLDDIDLGDYVLHIPEQYHYQDLRDTKYQEKNVSDMSDADIKEIWNADGESVIVYKNLIQDNKTSSVSLWSSEKINDTMTDISKKLIDIINEKFIGTSTVSLKIVPTLPDIGIANTLYILKGEKTNYIYIYDDNKWINTGVDLNTINLDNYYTKENIDDILELYCKKEFSILISDIKKDLSNPSDIEVASTKAISDAINDIGKKILVISDDEPIQSLENSEWLKAY